MLGALKNFAAELKAEKPRNLWHGKSPEKLSEQGRKFLRKWVSPLVRPAFEKNPILSIGQCATKMKLLLMFFNYY